MSVRVRPPPCLSDPHTRAPHLRPGGRHARRSARCTQKPKFDFCWILCFRRGSRTRTRSGIYREPGRGSMRTGLQDIMAEGPRCKRRKQANPRRKNGKRSPATSPANSGLLCPLGPGCPRSSRGATKSFILCLCRGFRGLQAPCGARQDRRVMERGWDPPEPARRDGPAVVPGSPGSDSVNSFTGVF